MSTIEYALAAMGILTIIGWLVVVFLQSKIFLRERRRKNFSKGMHDVFHELWPLAIPASPEKTSGWTSGPWDHFMVSQANYLDNPGLEFFAVTLHDGSKRLIIPNTERVIWLILEEEVEGSEHILNYFSTRENGTISSRYVNEMDYGPKLLEQLHAIKHARAFRLKCRNSQNPYYTGNQPNATDVASP